MLGRLLFPLMALTIAGAASPARAAPAGDGELDPLVFARGAKAWVETCGRCHNIRDAADLRDDQWRASVAHMRVRAHLTEQETRDIVRFLQGRNEPGPLLPTPPAPAADDPAAALYGQTCVACHGPDGKGTVPGTPDFTGNNSPLRTKDDAHLIKSVLEGFQSPGSALAMPARGGNPALTDADARELVRYLKARFGAPK